MEKEGIRHFAIYGKNLSINGRFLKDLINGKPPPELKVFEGKKVAVFSDIILDKFILQDYRLGYSPLADASGPGIRSFSAGEKRKALLEYQLKQQPDFLILDNPFDCLDQEAVHFLKDNFRKLSADLCIIQIFNRREDLLEIIKEVLLIENEEIAAIYSISEFERKILDKKKQDFSLAIPPSFIEYENIPETLVEMQNVLVNYSGKPVLKDISWKINTGEFWQLIGPNGSGKTTLLSMIYGDNPKAFGENIFLFGKKKGSGESVWAIKSKIGYYSPAVAELFKGYHTAEHMIISGLTDSIGLYQKPSDKQKALATAWLKTLNLYSEKNTLFRKLSLLQQRMILIARSMIKHPPLLILDEPSTSLDDQSAGVLISLINKIASESKTAIIYVSHRKENGLNPEFSFKLYPTPQGSVGEVQKFH